MPLSLPNLMAARVALKRPHLSHEKKRFLMAHTLFSEATNESATYLCIEFLYAKIAYNRYNLLP